MLKYETWVYHETTGLLERHTDRRNVITKYAHDDKGRGLVIGVTEALGTTAERTTITVPNDVGLAGAVRDPMGAWSYHTYNGLGQAVQTIHITNIFDVASVATPGLLVNQYDIAGQLWKSRDELGRWTEFDYNERGWMSEIIDPKGISTYFVHDNIGNRTQVIEPINGATVTAYDQLNRVVSVTDPLLHSATISYYDDGRVKDTTDARGIVTRRTYDLVNNKTFTTEAFGTALARTITTTTDEVGNVISVKNDLGKEWITEYDVNNLVKKTKDPLNNETVYERNNEGNVTKVIDPALKETSTEYDALGRAVKITDPLTNVTQLGYDAGDRVISNTNPLGHASRQVFDNLGRGTFTITPTGARTRSGYDSANASRTLTDPVGNKTVFEHDERGQVIEEKDPLGKKIITTYDAQGRVASITDRLGRKREFTYNDDNTLWYESWRDPLGNLDNSRVYLYNENRQLTDATDNNGSYTFTIDALGRVQSQTDVWGITLTNTWNGADELRAQTDSQGGSRTFDYDDAGRNTSRTLTTSNAALRFDIGYTVRSQVNELKRYTDVAGTNLVGRSVIGYDNAARLTSIEHKNAAGTNIDTFTYQLEKNGLVKQEIAMTGPTRNYLYFADGQLKTDGAEGFAHDYNGNRTLDGYGTWTGNRISTDGYATYAHDFEGNIESQTLPTAEVWLYGYNHLNQLVSAEHRPDIGLPADRLISFSYDIFGNRITKTVDPDGAGPQAAVTLRMAYDQNGNAWADMDVNNTVLQRHEFLDAVDAVFARIGQTGQVDWYLTDRLGSVRDIMNNSGAILDHIDYKAFGGLWNESNPAYRDQVLFPSVPGGGPRHSYSFTSRETDSETGLQYNRGRYYKFDIGRWMSEDPIRWAAGDANLYRYVGNNPTNNTDPDGLVASSRKYNWFTAFLAAGELQAHNDSLNQQAAAATAKNVANGDAACATQEVNVGATLRQAFGQGLDIGWRAVVNGGATALRSTLTLGIVDSPWEVLSVAHLSAEDRALYNLSFALANGGSELLLGLTPGAIASRCGRMANVARAANAFDAGGNVVSVVRGVAEGDPLRAVMGLVGLSGNAATMRQLNSLPCFTGEMEVITERGYVRWDELKDQDDYVGACDEEDPFGKIQFKQVEEIFTSTAVIWHVHVAGQVIRTTAEHPFYVWGKGWMPAWQLKPGDQLRSHDERMVGVEEVVNTGVEETVYNCRVADYHTYFVGQRDWGFTVWSHNRPCAPVNGNRRLSRRANHGYVIFDQDTGQILKYGVSSGRITQAGRSVRAERQLQRFRNLGYNPASAISAHFPNRARALSWELAETMSYRAANPLGLRPIGMVRP